MTHSVRVAALLTALLATPGLNAAEVAGVKIDEHIKVGGNELVLNGAGLRSKVFIKVYVGSLYVTQKASTAAALIETQSARRMSLRLLRDLDADTLYGALRDGLKDNNSEAELAGVPDVIQIKALGANVKRKLRSRQGKAYEKTTLAAIAGEVAGRNGLELVGDIQDVVITRVTQVYEQDLPFIKRLADEYGHGMNVKRGQLRVFKRVDVKAQGAVRTIKRKEVTRFRFKDKISTIVESAKVIYHDPLVKDVYIGEMADDADGKKKRHSTDELKINIRAETPEQAQIKAESALDKANEDQTTGTLWMMGEAWQEAGINVMLEGWKALDGKYLIEKATHTVTRGVGWSCILEMKRVRE